jgi:UDP-N-acetyl-D-mannosaminuronate dehydrogenase
MTELDVVIGGGEVGSTIYEIIQRVVPVAIVDIDKEKAKLPNTKEAVKSFKAKEDIRLLHICMPFTDQDKFIKTSLEYIKEYKPIVVVIHSTISRGTTTKISEKTKTPVIFSATRGVHQRFMEDMEYYTKFWATSSTDKRAVNVFRQAMADAGFKLKQMSTPDTLELAKLLTDTTYYGVLISYAQKTKIICDKADVDYDEMWQFADEGHAKLGNRPKMYPGYIGGHCVIPNLYLLDPEDYDQFKYINEHNDFYEKWMEEHND